MENLKKDLVKDIKYLETAGKRLEYRNDFEKIFATSEYTFKTSQAIKDIISIIDINNTLIKYIPLSIRQEYLKNYEQWLQNVEVK